MCGLKEQTYDELIDQGASFAKHRMTEHDWWVGGLVGGWVGGWAVKNFTPALTLTPTPHRHPHPHPHAHSPPSPLNPHSSPKPQVVLRPILGLPTR